ncbi:MAG: DUF2281 domain-containing protein [Cyclobacteriaceae bacterium]|jgi:hypothetical protein|nr:DUF2281 domain-containing protein [Cyclobacteriaceae bacterium]
MSSETLQEKIKKLPLDKQLELDKIVDELLAAVEKREPAKSGFGALKGTIVMSDDFDEPVEDFKDYM